MSVQGLKLDPNNAQMKKDLENLQRAAVNNGM